MVDKKKKKPLNKFARFSGMAIQMGITIFVGVLIGQYLDNKYPNDNSIYTLLFSLIFIGASLYSVIKQAIKLGNDE